MEIPVDTFRNEDTTQIGHRKGIMAQAKTTFHDSLRAVPASARAAWQKVIDDNEYIQYKVPT